MGRNFKFKQSNVLKAVESVKTKTISIRAAAKRFGVSKQSIEYAIKKQDQTHTELDKIQSLTPDKKTAAEIKQLSGLIYLSLEILREKLAKARAKDLAIVASILIDKRNLLHAKSRPESKIDFPEMSKKTRVLIEQYIFQNKGPKEVGSEDVIDSVPVKRDGSTT